MDSSLYKSVTTRRNFKYNYYLSTPAPGKPFVLFCHGFPSTSYDWRYQVDFFKGEGYGLIVPDLLGYGGTDKPNDPADYKNGLIAHDVVDILDAESVDKVVAIGHDWGSLIVSRLANYFPDRFIGFGFLAVAYNVPRNMKFEDLFALSAKMVGHDMLGYWRFFASDGAHELIEKNMDSFYSLMLAEDVSLWKDNLAASGGLQAWVEGNKKTKIVSFIPEEEVETQKGNLLKGGMAGPVNYYKVQVSNLDQYTDIPPENLVLQKPVFFGVPLNDLFSIPAMQKPAMAAAAKGPLTIKEFDAGHWLMWEAKDKLNQELLEWVKGL